MHTEPSPRRCDACFACCDYPAIPELAKPAYQLCQHASTAGCAIYAARPGPCHDYRCLWLDGEFEPGDRPDRIGLAFDQPTLIAEHPDYAGVQVICVRELWEGAPRGERAKDLLLRLSRAMVVRLVSHGGRTQVMGPRAMVELVAQRAADRKEAAAEPKPGRRDPP